MAARPRPRSLSLRRRGAAGLVLAALFAFLLAGPLAATAAAHANLVRSDPPAGAALPASPGRVQAWFSEDLEKGPSELQVLDSAGKRVDLGDSQITPDDPKSMRVRVGQLAKGVYTVSWKTQSAVDGHVVRGSFAFGIGQATGDAALAKTATADEFSNVNAENVSARWLGLVGGALILGAFTYRLWIWWPARAGALGRRAATLPEPAARRFAWTVRLAWLAFVLAALIALLTELSVSADAPVWQALSLSVLGKVLTGTRFGAIWLARAALLAALGVGIWWVWPRFGRLRQGTWWAIAGLAAAALFTVSLNAHGFNVSPAAGLADWVHALTMAIWLGALVQVIVSLPPELAALDASRRAEVMGRLVPRFSAVALPTVLVLTATGTYAAVLQIGLWRALVGTAYGVTLLVKLAMFGVMLGFAAVNLLYIGPNLARLLGGKGAVAATVDRLRRHFTTFVAVETTLGLLVLAAVGVLVNLSPPRDLASSGALAQPTEREGKAVDLDVTFRVAPNRPGANAYEVDLADLRGQPFTAPAEVVLRFSFLGQDLGVNEVKAQPVGGGVYKAQGSEISVQGGWQVQTIVRREGRDDVQTAFRFASPDLGATGPNPAEVYVNGQTLSGLAVLAVGAAAALRLRRRRAGTGAAARSAVAALVLFVFGAGLVYAGVTQARVQSGIVAENPFPPTAESVARGQQLYTANCAVCHGTSGHGDGPAARTLNPPPLDLTIHVPLHPDAVLYGWISNGVPSTAMPAWKDQISPDDRWHLLNYLHSIVPALQ
jgi:copper transport protein